MESSVIDDYWSRFAAGAGRTSAPLYQRLALAVGADAEMRAFASRTRPGQPPANMLFAAVHFLLIRGADHPLRGFYRDLGGTLEDDPYPVFCDFVDKHRDELAALIGRRITNTNEIGRSALLAPGFRVVADEAGEPLHLVEVGPSAGLNLIWDRYAIRYRHGDDLYRLGDGEPMIECALRGDRLPPLGASPRVASRVGLERHPVDLADPDERDWLKALIWPDRVDRMERLEKAIAAYAKVSPTIRVGDALDLLPEAVADIPADQPVCVYHTKVTYQFSTDRREAFEAILTLMSLRRPVWLLSLEASHNWEDFLIVVAYRNGMRRERRLALCHSHGDWLEWLDSACERSEP